MGWAGGTEVAESLWELVEEYIPKNKKKKVALKIIDILQDEDWDCVHEAEDLCKAAEYCVEDEEE